MNDLRLSEHFMLSEFERSETAEKYGIDNTVPSQYIPALQQLCREVLEPLRAFVGGPIVISSGYRCNQLNVKVGGAYASQHTMGEAADIRLPLTSYCVETCSAISIITGLYSLTSIGSTFLTVSRYTCL